MSFRLAQLLLALATVWPYSGVASAKIKPVLLEGLAVTFNSQNGGQEDTTVRPHFMLYVPLGQAPTPYDTRQPARRTARHDRRRNGRVFV